MDVVWESVQVLGMAATAINLLRKGAACNDESWRRAYPVGEGVCQ